MKSRAFTLVELLVVIAIIALIAAILFPAFSSAREKARQNTCMANEKTLGTALTMYVQDFDDTMMPYSAPSSTYWPQLLNPYVKDKLAWYCPDFPFDTGEVSNQTTGNQNTSDYGLNFNIINSVGGGTTTNAVSGRPAPMTLAYFTRPSDLMLMADSQYSKPLNTKYSCSSFTAGFLGIYDPITQAALASPTACSAYLATTAGIDDRHSQGANVLMLDMHAKWYPDSVLLMPTTAANPGIDIWGHWSL